MNWHVRLLEEEDEPLFVPFLGRRISDRCIHKHFDWLYRRNPHGDAVTWIAVSNATKKILGCTSTFPRLFNMRGKDVLASKGGDAYVDPDFRRQGIAQTLHETSVADMKEMGIACNFGVAPVPANFRAFIRAGALSPCDFDGYHLPLNSSFLVRRLPGRLFRAGAAKILDPLVHLYITRKRTMRNRARESLRVVERFDNRIDELFESVAPAFGICGKRDSAYLNWRFANHPFNKYMLLECVSRNRLTGYAVLDLNSDNCRVLDFLTVDDDIGTKYFIRSIARVAHGRRKHSVSLFLNPYGPYADLFKECGFMRAGKKLPLMALTTDESQNSGVFGERSNWFLLPGDEDST